MGNLFPLIVQALLNKLLHSEDLSQENPSLRFYGNTLVTHRPIKRHRKSIHLFHVNLSRGHYWEKRSRQLSAVIEEWKERTALYFSRGCLQAKWETTLNVSFHAEAWSHRAAKQTTHISTETQTMRPTFKLFKGLMFVYQPVFAIILNWLFCHFNS